MRTLLLCGAIIASLLVVPKASALFWDVEEDHPYAPAIEFVMKQGFVRGFDDRSFRPDLAITRAEFTKIVVGAVFSDSTIEQCLTKLATQEEILEYIEFIDVDYAQWYGPSLCIAMLSDIIQGYSDTTFRPENYVTFVEAAKILVSTFGIGSEERHDPDRPPGIWYKPFVEDMAALEAIPPSILGLEYPITRGEMAEMIYRIMGKHTVPFGWSLSYDDLVETVPRTPYINKELGFALTYPSTWPEPSLQRRGTARDGIPIIASAWRLYVGHITKECSGFGSCVERDLYLDGYDLMDVEDTVNTMYENENIVIVEDVFEATRWLILYDERTDRISNEEQWSILTKKRSECLSRRALLITEAQIFRLTSKCANDIPANLQHFEDVLKSLSVIARRR